MGFAEEFVGGLAGLRFEDAFNPYADLCPVYDLPNAPALRRAALVTVIDRALEQGTDSLWVGFCPGHRGRGEQGWRSRTTTFSKPTPSGGASSCRARLRAK